MDTQTAPAIHSDDRLERYANVWIDVDAEIDRTTLKVREILALKRDSIIKLSKPAGGNIELLAGGVKIGLAEIVAVDETAALRVAELGEEG